MASPRESKIPGEKTLVILKNAKIKKIPTARRETNRTPYTFAVGEGGETTKRSGGKQHTTVETPSLTLYISTRIVILQHLFTSTVAVIE